MAEKPSTGDPTGFRLMFDNFDDDKDGVIPASKFMELMLYMGYTLPKVEEFFNLVPNLATGKVRFQDFLSFVEKKFVKEGESEQEELYDVFCVLDQDGDGYICLNDLRIALCVLGYVFDDGDIGCMIIEGDVDGDGRLSYPEFKRIIKNWDLPREPNNSPGRLSEKTPL